MKVAIDAYYLNRGKTSMGIFQYNLLKNILKLNDNTEFIIFTDNKPHDFQDYNNVSFYISKSNIIQRNYYMKKVLKNIKIDKFYATFNIIPFLAKKKFQIILQNHDWAHGIYSSNLTEYISGNFYKRIHKYSAKVADINISNSKFTSEQTKFYSGKNSVVIYHDADPFYKNIDIKGIKPNIDVPEYFLLYVGRVFPKYKNINSILYAYNKIKKENNKINLIMVHTDKYRNEDYIYIKNNNLNIIDLNGLNIQNVKYLYKKALFTIYPSLYEGFGSPILEAQNSGSPLIVSNKGPLPEVAGNAALYFDGSWNDLYKQIIKNINNQDLREDLIKKGFENARRFSWEYAAKQTLEVILHG